MTMLLSDFLQTAAAFLILAAAALLGLICGGRYRQIKYTKESNR